MQRLSLMLLLLLKVKVESGKRKVFFNTIKKTNLKDHEYINRVQHTYYIIILL